MSKKRKTNDGDFIDKYNKIAKTATSASAALFIYKTTPKTSYNVSVSNKYFNIANDDELNQSTKPTENTANKETKSQTRVD